MAEQQHSGEDNESGSLLSLLFRGFRFSVLALWTALIFVVVLSCFSDTPRRLFVSSPAILQIPPAPIALSFSRYSFSLSVNDLETPKLPFGIATTTNPPEGIPSSWDHQPVEVFAWPAQFLAYIAIRNDVFILASIFCIGVCYRKLLAKWLLRKPLLELD